MRKMLRAESPASGMPASASAAVTAAISARKGASTSVSYTALRGLNQSGSLLSRSPRKKANAAGRNPAKPMPVFVIALAFAVDRATRLTLPAGIYQEFAVAGRPGDRAFRDADDLPAGSRPEPGRDPLADGAVDRRVAHNPALADVLGASLELRFDQRD